MVVFPITSLRHAAWFDAQLFFRISPLQTGGAMRHVKCGKNVDAAAKESRLTALVESGLLLASQHATGSIVQIALEAGMQLSGASAGAFLMESIYPGEAAPARWLAGTGSDQIAGLPKRRTDGSERATQPGEAGSAVAASITPSLRSNDLLADGRYDWGLELVTASSAERMRSYLAVPVKGRTGETLGTLVLVHPSPGRFDDEIGSLVQTLAAQMGVAMDNARLAETLSSQMAAAEAARSDLRAASLRLMQALEAAQMGTWRWNALTGLIDFDERAAELFGVEPYVSLSRDLLRQKLVFREDLAFAPEDLRAVAASDGLYSTEYRVTRPDGGQRGLLFAAMRSSRDRAAPGEWWEPCRTSAIGRRRRKRCV